MVVRLIVFVVLFGSVFGVGEIQMKMVDSRRNHFLVFHLQMKSRVVAGEVGNDMMIGWMIGVVIVLLEIVEVTAAIVGVVVVVVVVDEVVESAGVEVVAAVVAVAVEEEEPLEAVRL